MRLTAIVLTTLLFTSCKDNSNLNKDLENTSWTISSVKHSEKLNVLPEDILGATWQFKRNDSVYLKTDPTIQFSNFKGKYQLNEDSLKLNFQLLNLNFGINFKSQDSLVLKANYEEELIFTLTKKQ